MSEHSAAQASVAAGPPPRVETDRSGHFAESECLNCGADLSGPHCEACGQHSHLPRSAKAILHDFIHGVLHLDGKFWATLPLLFFKPGQLTRRYIDGERRKFVSPFSMFLFSVFAIFLVLQVLGIKFGSIGEIDKVTPSLRTAEIALQDVAAGNEGPLGGGIVVIESGTGSRAEAIRNATEGNSERSQRAAEALPFVRQALEEWRGPEAEEEVEEPADAGATNALGSLIDRKIALEPAVFATKLQANLYKFSWLLIPLSIPFVWLLFCWRKEYNFYDHAVFVTYSIAFATILLATLVVLGSAGLPQDWALGAFTIGVIAHHAVHMKYTYRLSKRDTLWRLLLLEVFVQIVLGTFLLILLGLGVL